MHSPDQIKNCQVLFFPKDRCVPCRSASLREREQRTSWPREEASLSHVPAPLHPSVSYIMPTIACRACLSPVQAILHFAASQYSSRCVHHLAEPGPSQSHPIEKVQDLAEPGKERKEEERRGKERKGKKGKIVKGVKER